MEQSNDEKLKCYEAVFELVAADEMFLNHDENGDIIFLLLCNDTFGYAVSDCERVKLEDCPKVLQLYKDFGWPKLIEFIIEQRKINGDAFNKPIGPIKNMMNEYNDALKKAKKENLELMALLNKKQ